MDQDKVLTIARAYADAVRNVMNPSGVFLYGSQSKGTATRDSDIDIAVVVDQLPGDYLESLSLLWKLTRSVSEELEPVLLSTRDRERIPSHDPDHRHRCLTQILTQNGKNPGGAERVWSPGFGRPPEQKGPESV